MRLSFFLVVTCAALIGGACGNPTVAPTAVRSAVSLSIEGNASLSLKGETSQLAARAMMSDGRVEDKTAAVEWSSADGTIATVTQSGLLTAMGDGRTVVTAKLETIAATRPVLVDLPVR
jgi:hypothetical protein